MSEMRPDFTLEKSESFNLVLFVVWLFASRADFPADPACGRSQRPPFSRLAPKDPSPVCVMLNELSEPLPGSDRDRR